MHGQFNLGMKVLVVASTFPADEADPVPAFVRDQVIALRECQPGLRFNVLAPHDSRSATRDFTRRPAFDEYRFHYFWPSAAERLTGRGIMPELKANPMSHLLIPFLFLGEFVALLSLTRKLKPDVIYAHWFTPQAVVASLVGSATRTPFVFTTHSADVEVWKKIPGFGRYVVRSCTRRARAFTAVSRRSMAKLQGCFTSAEWDSIKGKAAVIPMGVEYPSVAPPRSMRRMEQVRIVFLGRLVEKKGLQFLLPAYANVREQLGSSTLVIAGDGPMLEQLRLQVERLGLAGSVEFPGFVSGEAKARLLDEADIFVVPSVITASGDAEGMPVALMEGLSRGKVCIATAESGADEVLTDGRDGFLIPQKDVQALSAALLRAAGLDPVGRRSIESSARETARQFEWAAVAAKHYAFLLEPLDRARVRPASQG
jgi:glycosyltransferase involved in cell wall biosynthesis